MTPRERIKAYLALAAKATPGPWKWWTSCSWRRLKRDDYGITQNVAEPFVAIDGHPDLTISEADMAFIAASRTEAPAFARALLAVLEWCDESQHARVRQIIADALGEGGSAE